MDNKVFDRLTTLLNQEPSFVIEGDLNKNIIAEAARRYDSKLLEILRSDDKISKLFFSTIGKEVIFKKDVFLQFISQKEFLPDSYTAFKTKIGLGIDENHYLSEDSRVVLNWPYKDCILEGGQDKEDQKRDEVFFNEVLAPDQIGTILDNKVFTNWKRYDKYGEHDLDELNPDDNLIIKGNNLVVLHSLKKRFAGRVKLIYIDPPYNTGNDGFNYNDKFNHSTWLTFMRNRLQVAQELLSDDGVIFVQCDDNEQAYLKVLMDEVFKDNFIQMIEIKMNEGAANEFQNPFMPKNCEYGLLYAKMRLKRKYKPIWVSRGYDSAYNMIAINKREEKDFRKWKVESVKKILKDKNITDEKEIEKFAIENADLIFQGIGPKGAGKGLSDAMARSKDNDGWDIYVRESMDDIYTYRGRMVRFYEKNIGTDAEGNKVIIKELGSLWTDIKTTGIASEGGVKLKNAKKPEKLLQRIIEMSTEPGDIVLDYHLGSGTTAAVAHKMGRQYIGIEQLYYGENDSVVRLQNVINGDSTGISKSVNWTGGGSFVYCNIKNDANIFRERVRSAKEEDLPKLLEEVLHSSFLSYRVDPKNVSEKGFSKLSLVDKKRILTELVDNNTLYLNYSEIDDKTYNISEADKKHNKTLYGGYN